MQLILQICHRFNLLVPNKICCCCSCHIQHVQWFLSWLDKFQPHLLMSDINVGGYFSWHERTCLHYIYIIMTMGGCLKSPASRLFTQSFIQAQIKENIKAPHHWPLYGEFTGTGEFPAQRASNAENGSIWWRHHGKTVPHSLPIGHCFHNSWHFNNLDDF